MFIQGIGSVYGQTCMQCSQQQYSRHKEQTWKHYTQCESPVTKDHAGYGSMQMGRPEQASPEREEVRGGQGWAGTEIATGTEGSLRDANILKLDGGNGGATLKVY